MPIWVLIDSEIIIFVVSLRKPDSKVPNCMIILIIKPTRCTNFSNLFSGIKLYMFRTVPLSIIRSFSLYTKQWHMSYRFADSLRAGSGRGRFRPDPARKLYDIYHCCVYSEKLMVVDRGTVQNMQFYSKNKFEKLVHLVGFITRIKILNLCLCNQKQYHGNVNRSAT